MKVISPNLGVSALLKGFTMGNGKLLCNHPSEIIKMVETPFKQSLEAKTELLSAAGNRGVNKEMRGEERRGEKSKGKERNGKERKGKERKGKERKGKERRGDPDQIKSVSIGDLVAHTVFALKPQHIFS